jgi:hypothetical protein
VTIEAGLIVSRFVHYAFVLAIFGLSLFPLYVKAGDQSLGGRVVCFHRRVNG